MNGKIPTKFLKLKALSEVPRSEYMSGPSPKELRDAKKRKSFLSMLRKSPKITNSLTSSKALNTLTFNVASWVKVPESVKQLISLVICYKDQTGEYAVVVDEDQISDGFSLMLTGCVTLSSKGTPEYIKICIAGLKENQLAMVDDLYVQKVKEEKPESLQQKIA